MAKPVPDFVFAAVLFAGIAVILAGGIRFQLGRKTRTDLANSTYIEDSQAGAEYRDAHSCSICGSSVRSSSGSVAAPLAASLAVVAAAMAATVTAAEGAAGQGGSGGGGRQPPMQ